MCHTREKNKPRYAFTQKVEIFSLFTFIFAAVILEVCRCYSPDFSALACKTLCLSCWNRTQQHKALKSWGLDRFFRIVLYQTYFWKQLSNQTQMLWLQAIESKKDKHKKRMVDPAQYCTGGSCTCQSYHCRILPGADEI